MRENMGQEDIMTLSIVLLFVAILGLVGYIFITAVAPYLNALPGVSTTTWQQDMFNTFKMFDSMVAVSMAILLVGTIALAFFSRSKPFLAVFAVFTQVFFIIFSYFSSAFFQGITSSNSIIAAAAAHFPISRNVMAVLPVVAFVLSICVIVAMYSRPSEANTGVGY